MAACENRQEIAWSDHISAKTQGTSDAGSGVSGETSERADELLEFIELHNRMRVFCDLFDGCRPQINSGR